MSKLFCLNVIYKEWEERTKFFTLDENVVDVRLKEITSKLAASEVVRKFRIYECTQLHYMSKSFEEDYDPDKMMENMNLFRKTFATDEEAKKWDDTIAKSEPVDFGPLRWKEAAKKRAMSPSAGCFEIPTNKENDDEQR